MKFIGDERLVTRLPKESKLKFERACYLDQTTVSRKMRELIEQFIDDTESRRRPAQRRRKVRANAS